jgi:diguanylate cyclase (GGDEF)-like protein
MGAATTSTRRSSERRSTGDGGRAARDLVLASAVILGAILLAIVTASVDHRLAFALLVVVPVAMTVFSYRRYRDATNAQRELAALSMLDSLTGLPNRRALPEWYAKAIHRARSTSSPVAVLFIDLDRFKVVNDTYGHEAGDRVISTVADRLLSAARDGDHVIRYGGDEFVVICEDAMTTPTVIRVAEQIIDLVEEPIEVSGTMVTVSASVGISIVDGRSSSMDQVLTTADSAMYRAKSAGTGRCVVLEPRNPQRDDRQQLLDELRLALARSQFVLRYQPVVSMVDKSMIGVEALLRWQHPERGLLLPGMFVEELEETGLIVPVGAWVLETASRQAKVWQDLWPHRDFRVAINLSAYQLADRSFSDLAMETLASTGVRPSGLCFEITESAIIDDIDGAWATLRTAKERGVQLALDDFGTGFSSLSYLRRFKTDVLKIDRTFVDGLGTEEEDTAIVQHVIGLAHSLGMTTVAEGIEREEQYMQLMRYGCDHGQGFWFSRAQPSDVITQLLDLTTPRADRAHALSEITAIERV